MSYCCSACCLRCHRRMYYSLQEHQWVHLDGWPDCRTAEATA